MSGGFNLYAYANNDPINMSDPFGLAPDFEIVVTGRRPSPNLMSWDEFISHYSGGRGSGNDGGLGGGGSVPNAEPAQGEGAEDPCGITSILANKQDRAVVFEAIHRAANEVRLRHQMSKENATIGAAIIGKRNGGLSVGEVSENVPNGLQQGSSKFIFGCFGGCLAPLENIQAIAIALPPLSRQSSALMLAPRAFYPLAEDLGIPLFIYSPRDRAVTLIESGSEPKTATCPWE